MIENNLFSTIVAWAAIGEFIVGTLALIIQISTSGIPISPTTRHLALLIACGLTLAIPGFAAYLGAIYLATLSPGTVDVLVMRATGWAVLLGIAWGIIWTKFLLPLFAQLMR